MRNFVRLAITALVFWSGAAAQARAAIVVAPIPSTDMTPFYWALQQKLFEKAGLDVTVSVATSGAASMQAVIGKAADIGVSNTLALVTARGKNIPIVVVAAGSMYRSDILNDLLLKTPDNPAKTGKDMEGKTVAVTGLHDLLGIAVQTWIAQNGGDPAKVNFVEMPSAMMQPALDAKRVDFVAVYEPFVSTMLRNGAYKQFAAPFNSIAPAFMSTAWFAMGPWATEHRAAVATFNRVMAQAAKYVDDHYSDMLPLIAQFTKLPIETLKGMSRVYDAPSLDPATLQPLINTAFKAKEIPSMFNASDMVFAGGAITMATSSLDPQRVHELVIANHILALEGVLDAYGHVSIRNPADPNTFLMSRSRSAEIVAEDDILVHDFKGSVAGVADRELYLERFIHASIYASRPDAGAVIHSHSDEILPFSISDLPLQAVFHSASLIGAEPVPVWDTRTEFGDTNLLVESTAMGDSLSRKLQARSLVLMRGHGFAATGKTLINAVKLATALPRNARALLDVMQAGGKVTPLSPGEVAKHGGSDMSTPAAQRQWEYWCRRLGVPYQPGGF